jgi:DNA recombination protein RmuC
MSLLVLVLTTLLALLIGILIGWWQRSQHVEKELSAARAESREQLQEMMMAQFRNMATEILEQKKEQLGTTSQQELGHLLSPFQKNLELFRKRVEEIHTVQVESSGSLRQQLEQLSGLNSRLSADAQNLAAALQGKSQRRGAWGELILERTLELSGLERGREFEVQVSTAERLRPDAVIYLPEGRVIIVDAKVSLVDYARACNALEESERQQALTAHAAAVRRHITSLAEKRYPDLFEGRTPEMTMMFLPIEPAFGAALTADPQLFEVAFAHHIILVTPSTLLAALRTIHYFWKAEKQNKNVLEIARLGGVLHDRLVDFVQHLLNARTQLAKALNTQDEALARLGSQKGNLIATASRLHLLGAKTEKRIPKELLESFSGEIQSD